MRIISGSAKGRRISGPGGSKKGRQSSIRPTSDRVRESIFNILGPEAVVGNVLDLFAGTGALGIESLSHGSHFATFVDHDRKAIGLIKKNLVACDFVGESLVFQKDIGRGFGFLGKIMPSLGYDLIFIDPPYHMNETTGYLENLTSLNLIADNGLVVIEDGSGVEFAQEISGLFQIDSRRYGDTSVWIYNHGNNIDRKKR